MFSALSPFYKCSDFPMIFNVFSSLFSASVIYFWSVMNILLKISFMVFLPAILEIEKIADLMF